MMQPKRAVQSRAGFTLVELIVGLSLGAIIMAAVLTTYVTLGKNFTRVLGVSSANQPTLESQGRRTLGFFSRDVEMSSGISGSPSSSSVTLILPTANGTTTVVYSYDSSAGTLTRTLSGNAAQVLQTNLLSCVFTYYDSSNRPYTDLTNYLKGLKQVSVTFSYQAGSAANGTQSQVYWSSSAKLLLRNKALPN